MRVSACSSGALFGQPTASGALVFIADLFPRRVGVVEDRQRREMGLACGVSDAGIKQIGMLAGKQIKAHALWEEKWGDAAAAGAAAMIGPDGSGGG
ncbi:MAG: hypothetical protein ACPGSK_04950, partial [Alphaproteobacteria bacterium]